MNKTEVNLVGFEIVSYAGEARSKLLNAINEARNGNFDVSDQLIEEARESLIKSHNAQTKALSAEASGEDLELGFIMVHGQDHLMTTLLLSDIVQHLINIYRKDHNS